MNVKFYEYVNEIKKKKFESYEGVKLTTLRLPDHSSTNFTITFLQDNWNFFWLNLNHAKTNFFGSPFCCKCLYDTQQEYIYIKPWSIEFQVLKNLLVTVSIIKKRNTRLQNVEGKKRTSDLQISTYPLYHLSHSNHVNWSKLLKI